MRHQHFPRTLNEAFGPYTSTEFAEPEERAPWGWWLVVVALVLVCAAYLVASA